MQAQLNPVISMLLASVAAFTTLDATIARAQSPAGPPGLDSLLRTALVRNPDLVAARARADSARGERTIAIALPNPTLQSVPGVPWQYSVSVPLDVGPQRWYRARGADFGVSAARLDLADATRQVTFAVRASWCDLVLADSLLAIARETRDALTQLVAADSARVRAGDAPERDLARTRLELAHAEASLAQAASASRGARIRLQLLIGETRPDTAFAVAGTLAFRGADVPDSVIASIAPESRADLAAARERVRASEAAKSLAASQLVPLLGVGVVVQPNEPFANGSHAAFGLSASVPLWYWYGGERRRAAAGLVQARSAEAQTRAAITGDVALALADFRSARQRAAVYEGGLLSDATSALESIRYAYKAGAVSLLELLDALRAQAETRADYYTALHDYAVGAWAVDRAAGRDVIIP